MEHVSSLKVGSIRTGRTYKHSIIKPNIHSIGKRWTTALIRKLWDVAWDLWEFRNAVYHKQCNLSLHEDTIALDQKVRELTHTLALTGLLSKDKHLETIPIDRLLGLPRLRKVEWLLKANLALTRAKQRYFESRRSRHAQHRRHQSMISSMQLTSRRWIQNCD